MHKLDSARRKMESIVSNFSGRLMSDAKWVKILNCLTSIENFECTASVKLVWDTGIRKLKIDDSLRLGLDYYKKSMESMISGYPKGLYDYREIEWIEFHATVEQLEVLVNTLNKVGEFELEKTTGCVKLFAYIDKKEQEI